MHQPPLWPDGWEAEADVRNGTWRRHIRWSIPADYGRSCSRSQIPANRRVISVIRSL